MPDSSIPETGDKKPVLVEFDGANPIKYLNIKCYPKDGIKPPPSTGGTGGGSDIIKPSGVCATVRLNGRKQIRIESDTEVTVTVLRNTGRYHTYITGQL